MKTRTLTVSLVMLAIVFAGIAKADDDSGKKKRSSGKKAKQAEAIFDKIKSLSGDWIATKGEHKGELTLSVRVIAGGTAVVETEFPGSPQEMITVYHLDGNKVMLNHYCMLGNQPRMRVKKGDNDDTLVFEFAGATNLASKDDAHMHEGKLKFVDQDTVHSTWVMFKDDKAMEEHTFEMTRKK
ncbi:MAG: hypothetical protein QGF59_12845 [Pirellulaceae bacterium]|nr:hypothetical protein [Planctomycetaceae bacterium]MDP6554424.1 hypothetical protein [Pirellulaceae bacterium]MDP6719538.1 hypothetical protein [Pirellulaceae bacterium]